MDKIKVKLHKILDFQVDKPIKGFFLCIKKHLKYTKNGDKFLDIRLKDSTGSIDAKLWDNVEIFDIRFNEGDFVAVKGVVLEYKQHNFVNILSIKNIKSTIYDEYKFDSSLILTSKLINDKIWKELFLLINKIRDPNLRSLVEGLFNKNKKYIYKLSSVYNKDGSSEYFLEHIESVCKIIIRLKKHYKNINFDLVLTACMTYKIGLIHKKIRTSYLSLNYLSWELIQIEIKKIQNFQNSLSLMLKDIILNLDNEDKIKKIKSKEALISYYICCLDQNLIYYNKYLINDIIKNK